jgi:hypothetical protein
LSSRRPTSRLNGLGTDSTATRGGILVYNGSSASIRNTSLSGNMQANVWLPSAGAFVTNLQAQIQGVVRIGTGTIIETSPADGVSLFSGASFEVRNDTPSTIRNNIGFAITCGGGEASYEFTAGSLLFGGNNAGGGGVDINPAGPGSRRYLTRGGATNAAASPP